MTIQSDSAQPTGFAGRTVAAFESRMADHMATLISRHGGTPLVGPSMQEIPLENNPKALDFANHLMAGSIDMLILLTGVGTRTLVDVWKTRFSLEDITHALTRTTLVARGP
ncbi:MAG: uroporphyrinogen-III synthase, partial [Nitrospirales bacterium]